MVADSTADTDGETSEPTGRGRRRSERVADGGIDENELTKEWSVFIGSLLTVAGIGIGFFWLLIDGIDTPINESTGSISTFGFTFMASLAIVLAAFVGVYLALQLSDRQNPTKVAAVSMIVGTFGLVVTRVSLRAYASTADLAIDGLVINAVVAAIVAGGVAAAGVWIAQNFAPTGSALERASGANRAGQPSD